MEQIINSWWVLIWIYCSCSGMAYLRTSRKSALSLRLTTGKLGQGSMTEKSILRDDLWQVLCLRVLNRAMSYYCL
uniref:Putative secreted protein n=1 Tax=Xenopsylla cheopis TaxID=163159 RepID=A0A6M2DXE2_XENCH